VLNIAAILVIIAGIFGLPLYMQGVTNPCAAFVSELVQGSTELALPPPGEIENGTPIMEASMIKQHPYVPAAVSCTALYWNIWANPSQASEHTLDYSHTPAAQP
jgi:hypothetical protein